MITQIWESYHRPRWILPTHSKRSGYVYIYIYTVTCFRYFSSNPNLPHYPASNSLVFEEGMVELSFLVGIHEDGKRETVETFDVFLYDPWGGARLGSQQRTRVEIVDAESSGTTTAAPFTTLYCNRDEDRGSTGSVVEINAIAGKVTKVDVVARDALGRARRFGGDLFAVWVEGREEAGVDDEIGALSVRKT